jgi:citrate synthase
LTVVEFTPGLENIVAAKTSICHLDLESHRILIRGYDLIELAQKASFEEAAYLLLHGELPTHGELEDFSSRLRRERTIPNDVYEALRRLPKNTHPMDVLKLGIAALAPWDPDLDDNSHQANLRKAERLVAKLAILVANGWRITREKPVLQPAADLSFASNLLYMITGAVPSPREARIFEQTLILYIEHELAASTFAARVVGSTLSDIYGSVEAAIAALKGPLHGGANEKSMEMLLEIGSMENVQAYIEGLLERKQKIMGFGHRVYKRGIDPRAEMTKDLLKHLSQDRGQTLYYNMADQIQMIMASKKQLYPNLDFFIGPLYYLLGIPIELFTPVFAASRVTGWTAHFIEQQDENRIFRPRALYTGHRYRPYLPVEQRG